MMYLHAVMFHDMPMCKLLFLKKKLNLYARGGKMKRKKFKDFGEKEHNVLFAC